MRIQIQRDRSQCLLTVFFSSSLLETPSRVSIGEESQVQYWRIIVFSRAHVVARPETTRNSRAIWEKHAQEAAYKLDELSIKVVRQAARVFD